jgi:hypothetical protein
LEYGRELGLRFKNPEVQNYEEIASVDLKGTDLTRGFGRCGYELSVQVVSSRS